MSSLASFLGSIVRIILYPLTTPIYALQRLLLYLISWLPGAAGAGSSRRHVTDDPASVADRWVRELEEETGGIRESRLGEFDGFSTSTGTDVQAGPGPSTLSRRNEAARAHRRLIPEFYLGGYEEVLKLAQREYRLLCVVLVSNEHDDVPEFKHSTLVDPEFNKILNSNDFLSWGGDVRDYEASQAAQKLGATTFPFVAFLGLQPRAGQRNSSGSSVLTILSRHQGPSTPSGPTSPEFLRSHLTETLLPRVKPYLRRLQEAQAEREQQRRLREQQEAAFAFTAEQDRLRILAKMEEEKRAKEEYEMQEMVREVEEARRKREAEEREERERNRLAWYRYARRCLLSAEVTPTKESIRIGIRLPDGRREIRHFEPADSVTTLYVFVASQLIPAELSRSNDPSSPPVGFQEGEDGISEDTWSFKLALAFPRRELKWEPSTSLSSLEGLRGGAQVVVESIPGRSLVPGSAMSQSDEDDDYDTEEE